MKEQRLEFQHDDLNPAHDASVDVTNAHNGLVLEAIETVCLSAISARCVWISSRASAVINQTADFFTGFGRLLDPPQLLASIGKATQSRN